VKDTAFPFLNGGGQMGALMRAFDWSVSPVGHPSVWPQSLRCMIGACLNSPMLGSVLWGEDLLMFYNDAFISSLAELHPGALGRPVRDVWGDAWDQLAPHFEEVIRTGQGFVMQDVPIRMRRWDANEVTYWTFTATPIFGKDGTIVGLLNQGSETTSHVMTERRAAFMGTLTDGLQDLADPRMMMRLASRLLGLHLDAERAGYAETAGDDEHFIIQSDWATAPLPSLSGTRRIDEFTSAQIQSLRDGQIVALTGLIPTWEDGNGTRPTDAVPSAALTVPLVKDGRLAAVFYVHCSRRRVWSEDARTTARQVAETIWSVVERARAQSELRTSEARFQSAIQAVSAIGTWNWDLTSDRVYADARFADLYSVDPSHARRGAPISDFLEGIHPADRGRATAAIQSAVTTGKEFRQEYRLRLRDGSIRWVLAQGKVQVDSAGAPSNFPGVIVDITNEKYAEQRQLAMIEFTDRTRDVTDQDQISYVASEVIGRTLNVSRAGYGIVDLPSETITITRGWQAPGFDPLPFLLPFREYGSYIDDLKRGDTVIISDVSQDPRSVDFAASLNAINALAFINMPLTEFDRTVALLYVTDSRARAWSAEELAFLRDIAERTRIATGRARAEAELRLLNAHLEARVAQRTEELESAQAALRQSQKMEAVGQLTGGLAHDFNNLLTGITGSLEMLNIRMQQGRIGEIDRYVRASQGAAKRAAALTHRLLAFSRRQTLDPKPTDVNRLVSGMTDLLQRTMGPTIELESVAAGGLWTTIIDPGQLENALLNLSINARDAMPDGGKLTIETGNKWLDERAARERDVAPGQYVTVCVSDTGTGMEADVIARAFDPFFTTKPIGMGTGLGLSMVYGFARQSGGQVRIYSEINKGTMVCLYLPRHVGAAVDTEFEPGTVQAVAGLQSKSVLIVDDEPTVRMLVVDVLQEIGCVPLEAHDGGAALRVLSSGVKIDLLITDVGLPGGMNGRQVADAARQLRPNLEVLFITGYAENAVLSHGHLDVGMHVLTKPFTIEALIRRIKDLV
jgi:signal transduction histidine kinase/PAS domain-containing protein